MPADHCPNCSTDLDADAAERAGAPGTCPDCGTTVRVNARDLLWWLVKDPVFLRLGERGPDPLGWPGYEHARAKARLEIGAEEAVTIARGSVGDTDITSVFVVWDFAFLGGSMSSEVGARIAAAYDEARAKRMPIVLLAATGGARMQEGMASLVQMASTTVAATAHAKEGLLQIAVLLDPTTGGVFASHTNLADIVLAEARATIGFAGPRVAAAMTGGPLPEGSHTAEGACAAGLVDSVVERSQLPDALIHILSWTRPAVSQTLEAPTGGERVPPGTAWEEVQRARAADRPRTRDVLAAMDVQLELHGDRAGEDDPAVRVVLARLAGWPVVVVGLDRDGHEARVTPAGYRKAWRGMGLADRLGTPLITLIDTPGADASAGSEAGGIAHHIAQTFRRMLEVRSPTVAAVIGEGGSGGALALATSDRLLIQEHAIFSVIAPEGAAAILHRDESRAEEVAELLKPTARDLASLGIADEVIPEPVGHEVPMLLAAIARHVDVLARQPWPVRVTGRRQRWRNAGQGS